MNSFSKLAFAGAISVLALSACGDSDDNAAPAGSAVNRELAEEGIDFDASTMDAMSVDVVAGGAPAQADPSTADAGIEMLQQDAATAEGAPEDETAE
ncbi:hypothetical protein [Pacificimonas flava]|uniref:Secreted protein n=1 Tax=Pacificimonas flava TaxID=1234595 RepID=M2U3H9_9SPHN|nr:hypothetical protein [Pacificimonas flava]EMD82493.1 hypothetical protein C725_2214 [Pacificimonas flava]MBB5281325.1 hypothetical protein [Pacificimonas flava]